MPIAYTGLDISTDLLGPVSGMSVAYTTYFIAFTDEYTRFRCVYIFFLKRMPLLFNLPSIYYFMFPHGSNF